MLNDNKLKTSFFGGYNKKQVFELIKDMESVTDEKVKELEKASKEKEDKLNENELKIKEMSDKVKSLEEELSEKQKEIEEKLAGIAVVSKIRILAM